MARKRDNALTDVAGKIGSTLGIIAAEAAKVVRPLRAKRASHKLMLRPSSEATASGRSARRHATAHRRTKRSSKT